MTRSLTMDIRNDAPEMVRLFDVVADFCLGEGIDRDTCFLVELALEELITNTLHHGYAEGAEGEVLVSLSVADGTLTVELIDDGAPYDPLSRPPPDLGGSVEQRPVGGLGIHLVRATMDDCRYDRRDGRNHFTFVKRLPEAVTT